MTTASLEADVAAIRSFNRFYTGVIGLLDEGLLHTEYSLTEARVLWELAHRDGLDAATIRSELGLDASYLSRILGRFESRGFLTRTRSEADGRRQEIALTPTGRKTFTEIDGRSAEQVRTLLQPLGTGEREELAKAMRSIRACLDGASGPGEVVLRGLRPGDIGWVAERHATLYADEYRLDHTFEALTAGLVADFAKEHDPSRERGWIAELDGVRVGSIFCTRRDAETAKLRLLLVEPSARGYGIGAQLVDECVSFARAAGYKRMTLWTINLLAAARRIYQRAGFELVGEEPGPHFGRDTVGQIWERDL